jgi:hypothetical protein
MKLETSKRSKAYNKAHLILIQSPIHSYLAQNLCKVPLNVKYDYLMYSFFLLKKKLDVARNRPMIGNGSIYLDVTESNLNILTIQKASNGSETCYTIHLDASSPCHMHRFFKKYFMYS